MTTNNDVYSISRNIKLSTARLRKLLKDRTRERKARTTTYAELLRRQGRLRRA